MPIIWVVKLGGSLFGSATLPLWLEALAGAGVVLVPGGGPFADQVRAAQARWGFDDRSAHAMALLAMAQYGRMLCGLCPSLRAAADFGALRAAVRTGVSAVWLPDPDVLDGTVQASWALTSDSLAAWLAGRLGAADLLLVKSAGLPEPPLTAAGLAAEGLVDALFPRFIAGAAFRTWLCSRSDHARAAAGLGRPETAFIPVDGLDARARRPVEESEHVTCGVPPDGRLYT